MLRSKEAILTKLKEYVIKKNFKIMLAEELKLPDEVINNIDLVAKDGNNIIFYTVIPLQFISEPEVRKIINLELAKLSRLSIYANKVYLVIPEQYAKSSIVDGNMVIEAGVGLLCIDKNGNFIEKIPPKPSERTAFLNFLRGELEKKIASFEARFNDLIMKIDDLASRYERLESLYNELYSRLNNLERELNNINDKISNLTLTATSVIKTETTSHIEEKVRAPKVSGELPSFVRDNPWLAVLAKSDKDQGINP